MILARSTHPSYLSNAWLFAPGPDGPAAFVDAGADPDPLLREVDVHRLDPRFVLLTHHHPDHVEHARSLADRFECPIVAHSEEPGLRGIVDRTVEHREVLEVGGSRVQALHVPGHTSGQLAFLVDDAVVFTGDTLFRGTVGGTTGPGHATFEDLRRSILDVLLELGDDVRVLPGHADPTTVGEERRGNPFVRAWTREDPVHPKPCRVLGQDASLLLRSEDYDGGTKCWVRFPDGSENVVAGSRVEDA